MPLSVQIRRLSDGLGKVLGIQGYVPLTLIEDVSPTAEVLSPRLPELRWSIGHKSYGLYLTVPAVAAQFGFARLHNPAGSGRLVVLEGLRVNATALVGITQSAGASGSLALPFDTRGWDVITGAGIRGVAGVSAGSNVAPTLARPNVFDALSAVNEWVPWVRPDVRPIVLAPSWNVTVEAETANLAFFAIFHWREVLLAPQEATPG